MVFFSPPAVYSAESVPTEKVALNVGYVPVFSFVPFFIAKEKGYFEEQGLDVELSRFRSIAVMFAPLSAGELDVGIGRIGTEMFNAFHYKFDIKMVAGVHNIVPAPFLVRKDLVDAGDVTKLNDIAGKKLVLLTRRGLFEYVYAEFLNGLGLAISDVQLVTLPIPEWPVAFANDAVDAGFILYPFAGKILQEKTAVEFQVDFDVENDIQGTVMFFGQRLLQSSNQEIGVRFMEAYLKAVREVSGEKWFAEDNITIYSKYTNLPVPLIRKCPPISFTPDGQISQSSIRKQEAYFIERGYTDYQKPLPLSQFFTDAFLKQGLQR